MPEITINTVSENSRNDFLSKHFGDKSNIATKYMESFSKSNLEGYEGGNWNYLELSNGGIIIELEFNGERKFAYPDSFTEISVDKRAYSVIFTMYLLSGLMWTDLPDDVIGKIDVMFDKLTEYAKPISSCSKIFFDD